MPLSSLNIAPQTAFTALTGKINLDTFTIPFRAPTNPTFSLKPYQNLGE